MDDWREQVLRCAEKAGRPVRDWSVMTPAPTSRRWTNSHR
jgi:23S rRNA (cytosine1962-C5)-methyltransferase